MAEKEIKVTISVNAKGAALAFENTAKAASAAAAKIQAAADRAQKAVSTMAGASAGKAEGMFARMGRSALSAGAAVQKGMNRAAASAKAAVAGITQVNGAIEGMAGAATLGVIGSIAGSILNVGISCVKAAGNMEQYEIAFQTMLKSTEKGTQMLRDLQEFAAKTPFDVPGVVSTAQQLMAFGFQAEQIIPTLRTLGDAAAGLGKGSAGVAQMGYALGQIATSGTLKTQDVNQLATAGIDVWNALKDAYGTTIAEVKEMTERGMIDSADAVKIITDSMNDNFGGMMEQMESSINGLLSSITEQMGTFSATMGDYMADSFGIKDALKTASDALGGLSNDFRKAREEGKSFREAIGDIVPPGVIMAVGALGTAFAVALTAAVAAATVAIAGFIGISAPVIAAAAAIGAVVAAAVVYWEDLCDAVRITCAIALEAVVGMASAIIIAIVGLADGIVSEMADMWNTVMGYTPEWVQDIENACSKALDTIIGWAKSAIGWIQQVFSKLDEAEAKTATVTTEKTGQKEVPPKAETKRPVIKVPTFSTSGYGGRSVGSRSAGSAGSGVSSALNEEKTKIKSLVKQWTDADKVAKEYAQTVLKISEQKTSMLQGEANERAALADKLRAEEISHTDLVKGLQDELELAQKIEAADTRDSVTESIRRQIAAENELYAARQKALRYQAAYKDLQRQDKNMLDRVLGDPDDVQAKIDQNKTMLQNFLDELNSIVANAQASGMSVSAGAMDSLSGESMDFFSKMLNTTPEALQEEFDAKSEQVTSFVDFLKEKLAEGVDAQNETLSIGAQWAEKQQTWLSNVGKSMGDAVADWVMGSKSIGQAMADMVKNLIQEAVTLLSQWLSVFAIMSIWSGPTAAAKAANKIVLGIDAKAKGGRAKGLTLVGEEGPELVNFDRPGMVYTAGQTESILGGALGTDAGMKGYRNGGRVNAAPEAVPAPPASTVNLSVSAVDASSFTDFLSRGGLDTIRQALFDNSRNFADAAGVW